MESWIKEVFENYLIGEFTTIREGTDRPNTYPMLFFYEDEEFVMTSSVVFSKKVKAIKENDKVSLLLSNNTGSVVEDRHVVLIQGDAEVDDSDMDHGWEKYSDQWIKKEPIIKFFFDIRDRLPHFWKRSIIKVKPKSITAWKNGDMSVDPVVIKN